RWCSRARAIDEAALGADHPDLAYDLTCLGEARLGLGDPRAAVELPEPARALRERDATPAERAPTPFAPARALWAGGDRGRARSLAEEAAPHADPAARREAIRGWLREHPR